jgi:hypothetical protein
MLFGKDKNKKTSANPKLGDWYIVVEDNKHFGEAKGFPKAPQGERINEIGSTGWKPVVCASPADAMSFPTCDHARLYLVKWKNDPQNNYTSEFMMYVLRDPRLPKLKVPLREPKEVEYGATTQLTANLRKDPHADGSPITILPPNEAVQRYSRSNAMRDNPNRVNSGEELFGSVRMYNNFPLGFNLGEFAMDVEHAIQLKERAEQLQRQQTGR